MSVQPPDPSSVSWPANLRSNLNDLLRLKKVYDLLRNTTSKLEQRRLLETNPDLFAKLMSLKDPLLADILQDDPGIPVSSADMVPSKAPSTSDSTPANDFISAPDSAAILHDDSAPATDSVSVPDSPAAILKDDSSKPLTDSSSLNVAVPNLSTPMEIETSTVVLAKPTSDTQFVRPPKRLTAKNDLNLNVAPVIVTSNKFENLPEITPPANSESDNVAPSKLAFKTPKIRPIHFVKDENYPSLIQKIADTVDKDFTYTANVKFIKIFPKTLFSHTKIVEFLKDSGSNGFFSPVPDIIPLKVIVRGLDINSDPIEIQNSLTDSGYKPLRVAQLTSRKSGIAKKIPLFQIQLLDTPHNKTIFELTSLNYLKIKVEPYRNPRTVLQCFNCQGFNHLQANCYLPSKCLRCAQNHKSFECPNIIEKLPQPLCCNCNQNHPANYRGCVKFPKPRPFPAQKPVNSKFSYAQAVRPVRPTPLVAPPPRDARSAPIGQPSKPPISIGNLSESPLFAISQVITEIEQILNVKSLFSLLKNLKSLLADIKDETSQEKRFFSLVQRLPTLFSFAP